MCNSSPRQIPVYHINTRLGNPITAITVPKDRAMVILILQQGCNSWGRHRLNILKPKSTSVFQDSCKLSSSFRGQRSSTSTHQSSGLSHCTKLITILINRKEKLYFPSCQRSLVIKQPTLPNKLIFHWFGFLF